MSGSSGSTPNAASGGKQESRRLGRQRAFQVLYGLNFAPVNSELELKRRYLHAPLGELKADDPAEELLQLGPQSQEFGWELTYGVWSRMKELDEEITRHSQHWKLGRIAKIELTILRLALHEILHRSDIPKKVAINEAVELAKSFGDDNSGAFVNGILDAAAKA
ncbi:transcription antitermination factor NusB [Megalodesulfovibrio paquesii]